jgi:hypothetical protein
MSVQGKDEFRDPALKEAVCRCWGCDCASEHLRKRVAAMLAQEDAASGDETLQHRRSNRMNLRVSWILWPLAAAAAVLVSVSLFDRFRPSHSSPLVAPELASLETDLIRTHDHCSKEANHQGLPVPKNDDVAIADLLRERLKQPVLVYRPKDTAWKFRGASVCPVGSTSSGHLVFVKGDDALSIFSLPKALWPDGKEGSEFSATVQGHSIVGFVKDGALFCVVGSGPVGSMSVDELQQMSQRMKPVVAEGPAVEPTGVVLTELLRPIR